MKEGEIIKQSQLQTPPAHGDVVGAAMKCGCLHPFADGQWLYSGLWVSVLRRLQTAFVLRLRERLHFEEWLFPRMIPRAALESFELTHYRPGMLFGVGPYQQTGDHVSVLDPVQCVSLYQHLRTLSLPLDRLPIKAVECLGGWTWRNEDLAELSGPIRAREFLRVECVFVGLPQQVSALRDSVENEILQLLSDLMLSWRVVVGVGCMEISSMKEATTKATLPANVPVHDVETLIGDDKWLEISGCTVEGDHLTKRFVIKGSDGCELWSGCCGLGLNRLASALFLQHGFDCLSWPKPLRDFLNS